MATRSSRCSRSYQRLNSSSCTGSMSIDVSSMPFPAIGIFQNSLSHFVMAGLVPAIHVFAAKTCMPGSSPGMTSLIMGYPGGDIRNCLHDCIAHAGIIERVAGAFDDADFALCPARGERLRGRGRAEQVVAALHDDAGDALELV